MEDRIIDVFMACAVVLVIVLIFIIGVAIYQMINNKNCYVETYIEYPCEGATHYERIHRNKDIGCEKSKRICEE